MGSMSEHSLTVNNSFTKGVYRDVYPAVNPRNPELSKAGKIVMITGASRGIGKHGISEAFALAGAKAIIITARDLSTLAETEANIKRANPSTEVLAVALEITSEASVAAAFATVAAKYATVDILVNNAGAIGGFGQPLASADAAKWWGDFDVNVRGTMLVTRAFLSLVGPQHKPRASLVFVSSGAGLLVVPGGSAYSIAKLAGMQLAAYAAAENPGLHVVALHPGIVATDMMNDAFRPFAKDTAQLAGAVVNWVTSPLAAFLNGRYVTANWDVSELLARQGEIVEGDLLRVKLAGVEGRTAEVLG